MISMIDVSQIAIKKTVICILRFYTNKQYFSHVFYLSNYDGLIPSNTQGFPVLMKVSQRLSTSLPYAGDRSLYRRAFQNKTVYQISFIIYFIPKHFFHPCHEPIRERSCQLVSKIPILPCSPGLWAFCFSFDNVFEIAVYHIRRGRGEYSLIQAIQVCAAPKGMFQFQPFWP